jgi:hypothetical protein
MVHILQMPAQITGLGKCATAFTAGEGALACVLAEVVAQIAFLVEDSAAVLEAAPEQTSFLRLVFQSDRLAP